MMENLPIVYDPCTGTLFLVKNVGNQVLLMSPGLELTRLVVEDKNWMNLDHYYPDHEGSLFHYLCMTGETVVANDLFEPLLMIGETHDEAEVNRCVQHLTHWGVLSDKSDVKLELYVRRREDRRGGYLVEISGDGYNSPGNGSAKVAAEYLGQALIDVVRTGLFPSVSVSFKCFDGEDQALKDEVASLVRKMVSDEKRIKITN